MGKKTVRQETGKVIEQPFLFLVRQLLGSKNAEQVIRRSVVRSLEQHLNMQLDKNTLGQKIGNGLDRHSNMYLDDWIAKQQNRQLENQ